MIGATVKSTLYAKKLRARLVELKAERAKELTAFAAAEKRWQAQCAVFLKTEAPKNLAKLKAPKSERHGYRSTDDSHRMTVTTGMPTPPKYPQATKRAIEKVQRALRFLAITGKESVGIDEGEVAEFFSDFKND